MKVLLLGGPAHGQERDIAGNGEPWHVLWQELPPMRVVVEPSPRITESRLPMPERYVRVKFGRPDTRQTRVAWVHEPSKHLADRLLNNYLRMQWVAGEPA